MAVYHKWRGGPETCDRGAGAVGVGGCAWLRWPVAGLRCVSSARLRCARALLPLRAVWAWVCQHVGAVNMLSVLDLMPGSYIANTYNGIDR